MNFQKFCNLKKNSVMRIHLDCYRNFFFPPGVHISNSNKIRPLVVYFWSLCMAWIRYLLILLLSIPWVTKLITYPIYILFFSTTFEGKQCYDIIYMRSYFSQMQQINNLCNMNTLPSMYVLGTLLILSNVLVTRRSILSLYTPYILYIIYII